MRVWKYYISKNPKWHKNGRERQDQEEVENIHKCTMCNNTIKITLFCITTRKAAKGINNIINAVDWLGIANKYDRQIQEIVLSCSNKNERQWILWCHSSHCVWSKVQSPQSYPFSIKYLFQDTISEYLKSSSISIHENNG